jgi:hypothetical protein
MIKALAAEPDLMPQRARRSSGRLAKVQMEPAPL